MTFAIKWSKFARDQLAAGWLAADSLTRADITKAAFILEKRLATFPELQGESREPGKRVDWEGPLGFEFRINVRFKEVHIVRAWVLRKHE